MNNLSSKHIKQIRTCQKSKTKSSVVAIFKRDKPFPSTKVYNVNVQSVDLDQTV